MSSLRQCAQGQKGFALISQADKKMMRPASIEEVAIGVLQTQPIRQFSQFVTVRFADYPTGRDGVLIRERFENTMGFSLPHLDCRVEIETMHLRDIEALGLLNILLGLPHELNVSRLCQALSDHGYNNITSAVKSLHAQY